MAVPSRRSATGAGLLACSVILASCSNPASDTRPAPEGRYQPPVRFDDIYRNRAPEVVRYDRYTLVSTRPDDAQRDPLNQIIDIAMPAQLVNSLGEGFRYLLLGSGYSLCTATTVSFSELLSRQLPAVQRTIGPVKLSEALQILAGPAWRLKVDEVNREICFVLRDQYQHVDVRAPVSVAGATLPVKPVPPVPVPPVATPSTRHPFTGENVHGNLPVNPPKNEMAPQRLIVPSPALQAMKTPVTPASTTVPSAVSNVVSSHGKQAGALPRGTAEPARVSMIHKPSSVAPVTAVPPAPPVSSQTASTFMPGTPVTATPSGQTWRAEPGSTLKETLTGWAAKAACSNGGNWVVIWPVSLDYRIEAPLVFQGNFESVIVQVFDLYRHANKPLFAEANRIQCLISVSDTPLQGGR